MKKIALFCMMFSLVATSSFAAVVYGGADTSGKLNLGTGSTGISMSAAMEPIGLSPKVEAKYATDGTDSVTAQWYSIATVHPGGNEAYGTAQNLNNILKKDYETGALPSTVLDTIPVAKGSESDWTDNTWAP